LPISRIIGAGVGIALVAILIFAGVWIVLAGAEPLVRLSAAVCLPPMLLTVASIVVYLYRAGQE